MQPDAADLREVAEEAGDLGDPGPLVDGEQGLRWQPAAGQARDLAQCRQRLGEDARDERAAVAAVRRAGDVEDGGLAPDRCEVDLAVPEHAADVVVAEGHEVVARGGDEGLRPRRRSTRRRGGTRRGRVSRRHGPAASSSSDFTALFPSRGSRSASTVDSSGRCQGSARPLSRAGRGRLAGCGWRP